jgi:carbamoyl-phosphate synthase large subunit
MICAESTRRIMVIGSGPIVIGQGCEFDYSGVQACKVLRREGYRIVLVNSNPATIMTDPEFADATYVEPLTPEICERIIQVEQPDAILPTVGGQTALNLALALRDQGILDRYNVELIGASITSIELAEDRQLFKDAMTEIGLKSPQSEVVGSVDEALSRRNAWATRCWCGPHSRWAAAAAAWPMTRRNCARWPSAASS